MPLILLTSPPFTFMLIFPSTAEEQPIRLPVILPSSTVRAAIDRLVECQIVAVGINGAHVQFDAFEGKGGLQFEVAGICQRFSVACYDTGFWRCACSCFVV